MVRSRRLADRRRRRQGPLIALVGADGSELSDAGGLDDEDDEEDDSVAAMTSYTGLYRPGLIELLGVLKFRSTNRTSSPRRHGPGCSARPAGAA